MDTLIVDDIEHPIRNEPVAIVGVGMRLPGEVFTLQDLETLLFDGVDAITDLPEGRWSLKDYDPTRTRPGTSYVKRGGFVHGHELLDANFFSLSATEASWIDPQHRMLLETNYEAIESAGLRLEDLAKKSVGVFVGISTFDHVNSNFEDVRGATAYTAIGGGLCIAANRISHVFDLSGPSMAVDTACSSGLTAMDAAVRSLQDGTSDVALVSATNALLNSEMYAALCAANMLSPYGLCHAFDACADGYVRSEGAVAYVLKRAASAIRDADPILGLVLGCGCNADGRTLGISRPSSAAQRALLERVHKDAGVDPSEIVYVEAHGTGTPAGDPEEARAIGQAIGSKRQTSEPVPIGSIKTNLGHTEAAAGLAGVAKALVVLESNQIPPSLNFKNPNPNIDFEGLNIDVVAETRPVTAQATPKVAVNSFGFGGANAHVVLEKAPTSSTPPLALPDDPWFIVTARCKPGLRAQAANLAEHLRQNQMAALEEVSATLMKRRTWHSHRHAFYARDRETLLASLDGISEEATDALGASGIALSDADPVFVFTGNGSQWQGMGRSLARSSQIFRRTLDEMDDAFGEILSAPISDHLLADDARDRMANASIAQPALFVLQVGLVRLLNARGVRPAAVVGHSVGEITAAYIAGVIDLPTAAKIVRTRSELQDATAGQGAMVAISKSADEVAPLIDDDPDLTIACRNAPESTVVAGAADAIDRFIDSVNELDISVWPLGLNYGFHSAVMEPLKAPFEAAIGSVGARAADIPFYSTISGGLKRGEDFADDHWWQNIREPVLFSDAIGSAIADGHNLFLEIGPHPNLIGYISSTARTSGVPVRCVETLRRDCDEPVKVRKSFLDLVVNGARIDASTYFPGQVKPIDLPRYAWQRERHYRTIGSGSSYLKGTDSGHALLGDRLKLSEPTWMNSVTMHLQPELEDHKVRSNIVFPAAAHMEVAASAVQSLYPETALEFEQIHFSQALIIDERQTVQLQTAVDPENATFKVSSRAEAGAAEDDRPFVEHARGKFSSRATKSPWIDLDRAQTDLGPPIGAEALYEMASALGLHYGPAFRTVRSVRVSGCKAVAHLRPNGTSSITRHIDPMLLDGAFQATLALAHDGGSAALYLPVKIDRLRHYADMADLTELYAYTVATRDNSVAKAFDITLATKEGNVVAAVEGLQVRRIGKGHDTTLFHEHSTVRLASFATDIPTVDLDTLVPPKSASIGSRSSGPATFDAEMANAIALSTATTFRNIAEAQPFAVDDLVVAGVLAERHREYADMLLSSPNASRFIRREENRFEIDGDHDWGRVFEALSAEHPDRLSELVMLSLFHNNLAAILRDEIDAADLYSKQGTAHFVENYLDLGGWSGVAEADLTSVLKRVVDRCPSDQRLRVLEIGSFSSRPNATVRRALPNDRVDYVLVDGTAQPTQGQRHSSDLFGTFQRAGWHLSTHSDLSDLGGHFHIAVATGGLRDVPLVEEALRHLRGCLGTNGLLVVCATPPNNQADLMLGGLGELWRKGDDPWRRAYCRPDIDKWPELFRLAGFEDEALADAGAANAKISSSIAIARNGSASHTTSMTVSDFDRSDLVAVIAADTSSKIGGNCSSYLRAAGVPCVDLCISEDTIGIDWRETEPLVQLNAHGDDLQERLGGIFDALRDANVSEIIYVPGDRQLDEDWPQEEGWSLVATANALAQSDWPETVKFTILTEGLFSEGTNLSAAAAWGIGRTMVNELHSWTHRRIDVERTPHAQSKAFEWLAYDRCASLSAEDVDADELIFRDGGIDALELLPVSETEPTERRSLSSGETYAAVLTNPGAIDNVCLRRRSTLHELGADEVEIEVRTLGLNFRDVLLALGVLPPDLMIEGDDGFWLGFEGGGVVKRCGSNVTSVSAGMPVMFQAEGAFTGLLTLDHRKVLPIPEGWSYEDAATIPAAGLTITCGLRTLARLAKDETILIHGGAGAVGLTAIQYAKAVGAKIIATAGSDTKRNFLRGLGVDCVSNSRSLDFVDDVRAFTDGAGVDVVLNSIAGEAMEASLGLLRPGGRFVELGKRDMLENRRVGLHPFAQNISYFALDLRELDHSHPDYLFEQRQEMWRLVNDEYLKPLPRQTFPMSQIKDALRYLQSSRNIGKVVLDADPSGLAVEDTAVETMRVATTGAHVITGGLGGIGLEIARWLVGQSARDIVLVGRRGISNDQQKTTIQDIEALGARVTVLTCDVTDPVAVHRMLDEVRSNIGSIRGITHCVMAVHDAAMANLTSETFGVPLKTKVIGAINLHSATKDDPLDYFNCLSSAAAAIGNPGQANYCAANAVLDSMMKARRDQGLCGFSLAPGAVGGVGYIAKAGQEKQFEERFGELVEVDDLLRALDTYSMSSRPYMAVLPMDNIHLLRIGNTHRFAKVRGSQFGSGNDTTDSLIDLAAVDPDKRMEIVIATVLSCISQVTGIDPSRIDLDLSFMEIGLDSLMAVELGFLLEKRFGRSLGIDDFTEAASIEGFGVRLLMKLGLADDLALTGDDGGEREAEQAPASDYTPFIRFHEHSGHRVANKNAVDIVCVPDISGVPWPFQGLSDSVQGVANLYALRSRGTIPGETAFESYAAMLESYMSAIVENLPTRPIVFAGISAGGFIANDLACRCRDASLDVRALIIGDMVQDIANHATERVQKNFALHNLHKLVPRVAELFEDRFSDIKGDPEEFLRGIDQFIEGAAIGRDDFAGISMPDDQGLITRVVRQFFGNTAFLYGRKEAVTFDGPMLLIRAADTRREFGDEAYGWDDGNGALDIVDTTANHLDLMKKEWMLELGGLILDFTKRHNVIVPVRQDAAE